MNGRLQVESSETGECERKSEIKKHTHCVLYSITAKRKGQLDQTSFI